VIKDQVSLGSQLQNLPQTDLAYTKPVISPTPVGIAAALAPVAYEQTKEQQFAGSDSMGKTIATRMKDTVRDIEGTPSENKKKMKAGGKIGRGCGSAMRGAGKVMKP